MPTKKQLHFNLESDLEFGLSAIDGYGDEHLSSEELQDRRARDYVRKQRIGNEPRGEIIGHYVWDKETDSLKLIPVDKNPSENGK